MSESGAMAELPPACSLTPGQAADRAAELRALARRALESRELGDDGLRLVFRAEPGTASAVRDLARRERECCPFLDLRVEEADGRVTLAIGAAPEDRAALDAFYALAAG
jgi:hypothetical protein